MDRGAIGTASKTVVSPWYQNERVSPPVWSSDTEPQLDPNGPLGVQNVHGPCLT